MQARTLWSGTRYPKYILASDFALGFLLFRETFEYGCVFLGCNVFSCGGLIGGLSLGKKTCCQTSILKAIPILGIRKLAVS